MSVSVEHRYQVIREAIRRGDAEVRSPNEVFVHMRAPNAQHHARTLAHDNFEVEGPGAVFIIEGHGDLRQILCITA